MDGGSASPSAGCGPAPLQRVSVPAPDGLELSVQVAGSGPSVLLIHGFTGSSEAWGEGLIQRLARSRRVVVPDLVGHGASARPHDPERYRLDRVLDDLVAVQHACARGPAVWVGYSMGGRIALAGAVRRLVPLAGLILESASPGLASAEERRVRMEADERWARALEAGGLGAFVDDWMAQPLFRSQHALPRRVRERERARRMSQDPRALAACLRGLGTGVQPSMWDGLDTLDVPNLVVTGALDEKFEGIAREMIRRLPRARYVSVAGAGHAVHLEASRAWEQAVDAFLDDSAGTGT